MALCKVLGRSPSSRPTSGTLLPVSSRACIRTFISAFSTDAERQAHLKSDTDKLLKLSQELKEYVDKSNENMLSIDVLKKAEEIEKLARSVKDKMKGPN